jgi:hypothetical protein
LLISLHQQYLVKLTNRNSVFVIIFYIANPPAPIVRSKNKEEDKRLNEERIRCESDLKRIYIYGARAIQTQDQTNLNRYALVKGRREKKISLLKLFLILQLVWNYLLNIPRYLQNIFMKIIRKYFDVFVHGMHMIIMM